MQTFRFRFDKEIMIIIRSVQQKMISFLLSHMKHSIALQLHRPCFPNTDHMTIPGRFQPSSCSLKRLHASTKISNVERKYCAGYRHMICIGKTKSWTSEKGLLSEFVFKIKNGLRANFALKLNSF